MITGAIEDVFANADCRGWLCVAEVDGAAEVSIGADDLVAAASVFKVAVALEVARQISAGELDATARIRLEPGRRTVGPTGFSTFDDGVEVSVRDLARMMLTISDNAATDVLIECVGLDRVHSTLAELGLFKTVIPAPLSATLDSIAEDAGFANWQHMLDVTTEPGAGLDEETLQRRVRESRALSAQQGIRTTARDMVGLLQLIWRDEAGPPEACGMVRRLMGQQVSRQRLASGFELGVDVAAKSGSLLRVVRNEVGVITLPDGRRYAAAVFTRSRQDADESRINAAIGKAAVIAISHLSGAA